jgi:hypothetical protein
MATVIEIVKAHLTANGFGGLVAPMGDCGCEIDDLVPCTSDCSQCMPGYKHMDPRHPDDPHSFAIWKQKEPPTDEQWATVCY